MKRSVLLAVAFAALAVPVAASAHPLGNFTVNRFSRVEVAGPRVYVQYVLDLAEIPTFQAGQIEAPARSSPPRRSRSSRSPALPQRPRIRSATSRSTGPSGSTSAAA